MERGNWAEGTYGKAVAGRQGEVLAGRVDGATFACR